MALFPRLENLRVGDYDLYPGTPGSPGLSVRFEPGLTLVLGANGLGKTTLVWILYRMLSGPYDIPKLNSGDDLGGRRLEPKQLGRPAKSTFARRVVDNAKAATGFLSFYLGDRHVCVRRRLHDLSLMEFTVDGAALDLDERTSFQSMISDLAGLWSFGDWIVMLRYITFYFEDRRELVWDFTAQRQVLRLLFLPEEVAQQWTERERRILTLDSRARNLNAALTREEKALAEDESLQQSAADVREELKTLSDLQQAEDTERQTLDETFLDADAARKAARLRLLRSQQQRESTFRAREHAKLAALEERFPSASETARYLLAQILTESHCLACGNRDPALASELERRLTESLCVICGSSVVEKQRSAAVVSLSDARLSRTYDELLAADREVESARENLSSAEQDFDSIQIELHRLDASIAGRRDQIDRLLRKLPKEEAILHKQRGEIAVLRRRVGNLRNEVERERSGFFAFITSVSPILLEHAQTISEAFQAYAEEFLVEDCKLTWTKQRARVGQSGISMEYPTFEFDMASASFRSPVRRGGPDQVSQSQREFIDLSFRMALMEAADPGGGGTLVIDAPESSLDAVFVHRAADALSRFAQPDGMNHLVVTSNLTDGGLIPRLLDSYSIEDRNARTLDLFDIAEPTAAVRSLSTEYAAARSRLLAKESRI